MRALTLLAFVIAFAAAAGEPKGPLIPGNTPVMPVLTDAEGEPVTPLKLELAFPKLKFKRPVWFGYAPHDKRRFFVIEQEGVVHVFPNDPNVAETRVFLDITRLTTRMDNEEGLLALAFDPKYEKNGHFYAWYSALNPRRNVLARFTQLPGDPDTANPGTHKVLLEIEKPFGNHNGATLLFGKDKYLYISVGDGGAGGDPQDNGQNLNSLLGKILRIDVSREEPGRAYAIPKDNPFVGKSDAKPEIYAYGLRNVWRMSFDRDKGDLWAGDIGQDKFEEIDVIEKGGNYGWRVREGLHAYKEQAADPKHIDPVAEYGRTIGASITGGYVYRGKRFKYLEGAYICADYVTGTVLALHRDKDKKLPPRWEVLVRQTNNIASFGEDPEGELVLLAFDGRIYKLADNKK